jgi:hypothetical protein
MSIFHGNAIPSGASAYSIDNSCRFDAAEARMHKTPSGDGNRKTWTISFWWKKTSLANAPLASTGSTFFSCTGNPFKWRTGEPENDEFQLYEFVGGYTWRIFTTEKLFRDPTAWYHIVLAFDSTQATDTNRVKVWINGTQYTSWTTTSWPSLNHDSYMNKASTEMAIGGWDSSTTLNGLCAEYHLLDGTAVSNPDDFGEVDATYGHWKPKKVTGLSYGTNGFYLDFKNAGAVYETGNRSSSITVTYSGATYSAGTPSGVGGDGLVSGTKTGTAANGFYWTNHTPSSAYMRFEFSSPKTITEVKYYSDGTGGSGGAWGTWKWQGSNTVGGASGYVDIGSSFTLGGSTPYQTQTSMSANTTAYTYYQLTWVSGSLSAASWHTEIEFGTGTSAANGLGTDVSGEGNHLTLGGITTSDQMVDSPTNNFATFNALHNYWAGSTFSEGNLKVVGGSSAKRPDTCSTIGMSTGKWYCEGYLNADSGEELFVGIVSELQTAAAEEIGHNDGYGVGTTAGIATVRHNDSGTSYGSGYHPVAGNIVQLALDLDNNKMYWGVNGTWHNSTDPASNNGFAIASPTTGHYHFAFGDNGGTSVSWIANFGQDGTFAGTKTAQGNADDNGYGNFYYAPPSGFLALCSKNLPDPTVVPSEHFNTVLYTGNSTTNAITDVGFQPDMVWLKGRSQASYHGLYDVVRGAGSTKGLYPNTNDAEGGGTNPTHQNFVSFDSGGFTLGATSSSNIINDNTQTYVGWNWKANGSGASNTDGTINTTSTSANVAAGFSIVSYTGNDTGGATVGHGLSVAPEIIILKRRTLADDWLLGTLQPSVSVDWTDYFKLHTSDAVADINVFWNDTAPTASVFTVGTSSTVNSSSHTYIAYCWHSVEGYSKIGSYQGNANADGTFVYTGFRPAWVMIKCLTGDVYRGWLILNTAMATYNPAGNTNTLFANSSQVEGYRGDGSSAATNVNVDVLSNGFKIRSTANAETNSTSVGYIYMAFAETPFKYANAR